MHESVRGGPPHHHRARKNHFALAHAANASILLVGGIGITPLLCMAERLSALDAPFELNYCTRSRRQAAFLERISQSPYAQHVHLNLDDEAPQQRLHLQDLLGRADPGVHVYNGGPRGFMDAVLFTARSMGGRKGSCTASFSVRRR